ncbi:hypothetical protein ABWH74_003763 [Burkholderia vietnamiensis]|jgi:hypothetical protein|uniref:hypothetical protein n=1 Tax=Burkholderia vietnamiensis TaxID=60552 RepID=UPI0010418218|nr:hypothetical protein [Burkholderia vietnamiensis]MBR8280709.1 hypothetical protein [Burkholderia vietnamiensis]MCA8194578.1 hypothetical protein [Burkholderia vietnamiensis]MDN7412896.1 hypothetical protein [Burkholderia vietnamiensis]QTK84061.1 hypothetical protein J4D21_11975 [Burkholderia vietnamiensis]WHU92602.1 hypothetical protein P4G95_02275 [Burkholderia vietnamiensis]
MHARPDANVIRRNIDMHALADTVRLAGAPTDAHCAASFIRSHCDATRVRERRASDAAPFRTFPHRFHLTYRSARRAGACGRRRVRLAQRLPTHGRTAAHP